MKKSVFVMVFVMVLMVCATIWNVSANEQLSDEELMERYMAAECGEDNCKVFILGPDEVYGDEFVNYCAHDGDDYTVCLRAGSVRRSYLIDRYGI